ncbi:hypothetical protein GGX14DRAFT_415601 [Mycena pura]|uniref:DUF6534 domain-containing protein n=1 Tax=Mycena pura TaxID=153505 RepID=A0AAD7E4Z0_9AGAR|nr:hypothetical protein GGX14DRAFT_415601 [Mycena pura]
MASSQVAPSVLALVKQGFATSFIGFSVATAIYGISVLQVYLYYRNYASDRVMFKCVVRASVLDTLATIFVAHSLYTYFVLHLGKNLLVDLAIPWSFSTLITFVAQIFYAQAIWRALGIVTTVAIFTTSKPNVFGSKRFSIVSGCVQGLAALNDLLITAGMCYHLQSNRSDIPSTSQFVDKLILYTVSRGILTALTQIIFLVTNVAFPGNT